MLFLTAWGDVILIGQGVANIIQAGIQIAQTVIIVDLLNKITSGAWLLEQARKWGFYFDKIIIKYSGKIYDYFVQLLEGTLLTPEVINSLMNRLYVLVGLMIFFKLAMIAINYITAPETFLDDKLGAGSLVKRIIIGSVVIIMIPTIFNIALGLQKSIIKDNVIAKIILPDYAYRELTQSTNTGRRLANTVFEGFFGWNEAIPYDASGDSKRAWNDYGKMKKYEDPSMLNDKHINLQVSNEFVFYYVPIISTLALAYLMMFIITYTLEVALRTFKLAFLQVIAPFVLVNYMIDPSKEEGLKKWLNTVISSYILIFVRVITLWFVALMAYFLKYGIPAGEGGANSLINSSDPFLKAIIVLALFAFLKDLPKLISDIFGYNLQENETVTGIVGQGANIVKGFAMGKVGMDFAKRQAALGAASAAVGGIGSVAGGAGSAVADLKKANPNAGKGSLGLAAFAGGSSATIGSIGSIQSTYGQTLSSSMGQSIAAPAAQAGSIAASNASRSGNASAGFSTIDADKQNKQNAIESEQQKKQEQQFAVDNRSSIQVFEDAKKENPNYFNEIKNTVDLKQGGAVVRESNTNRVEFDDKNQMFKQETNPVILDVTNQINQDLSQMGMAVTLPAETSTINNPITGTPEEVKGVSERIIEYTSSQQFKDSHPDFELDSVSIQDLTEIRHTIISQAVIENEKLRGTAGQQAALDKIQGPTPLTQSNSIDS